MARPIGQAVQGYLQGGLIGAAGRIYGLTDNWLQPDDVAGPPIPDTDPLFPPRPSPQQGGDYSQYGGINFDYYDHSQDRRIRLNALGYTVRGAGNQTFIDIELCSGAISSRLVQQPGDEFRPINIYSSNACFAGQPFPTGDEVSPARNRPYNPLEALPQKATPAAVPPPFAPTPAVEPPQVPATRPKPPPAEAPETTPVPAPVLPAGDPLIDPAPQQNPTADPGPAPPATPANVPAPPGTRPPGSLGPNVRTDGAVTTGSSTGWRYPDGSPVPDDVVKEYQKAGTARGRGLVPEPIAEPVYDPSDILIPALLAAPLLFTPPTTTTGKVGDPTVPGNFTQPPPPTPPTGTPTPPDTGCRCNGPILASQAAQAAEMLDMQADLEAIKQAIGVQGLPASVPDQIAKQNPGQRSIGSLAELHLWQVEQLDGVMGRWPQQIPVPTPTGTVNVGMPNVSETMAEIIGMLVSQQVTASQILHTSSRALHQAGSATQQAHLAHLVGRANAEFLGYDSRANATSMPLAYTPGLDPFDGMLQESGKVIRGFTNTDPQDMKTILAELLQAAAIIRAVYWRKLDPRTDLKKQIQATIKGQSEFVDEAAQTGSDEDSWAEYLRQVEEGFREFVEGETPYGRNEEEAPKIRDLKKKDKDKK